MNRTIQATHPDFPELTKTRTTAPAMPAELAALRKNVGYYRYMNVASRAAKRHGAEVKLIWDAKHESGCYRVYVPAKAAAR